MRRYAAVAVVLALVLGSCGVPAAEDEPATTLPPAPDAPEAAARALIEALSSEDYAAAAGLTAPGQAVTVALIEGVPVGEAATLAESGSAAVAASFWEAFAAGLGDFLGRSPADVGVGEATRFGAGGRQFARVELSVAGDPARRALVLQQHRGWRVDLIASFPGALAGKLAQAVQAVRSHPDPGLLPEILAAQRPSLEAVLQDPELTPELRQAVISSLVAYER